MAKFRLKPIEVEARRLTDKTIITMPYKSVTGVPGEWLVLHDEKAELFSDEEFRKAFDPVDEEAVKLLSFLQPKEAT